MGRKRRKKTLVTRTSFQRVKKWDAKVDGATYAQMLEKVKPIALERFASYQPVHRYLIDLVRDVINSFGVDYGVMQEYMWYVQKLWYLTQRYSAKTLQIEADSVFLYYVYRGRNENILRAIAGRLGINISSWDDILSRLGVGAPLSEDVVYRGTKKALQETLERVETDLTDAEFTYDANDNLVGIVKTDKVTGKKKKITLEYDAEGRLVKKTEEYL